MSQSREVNRAIAKTLSDRSAGVPNNSPYRIGQIFSMSLGIPAFGLPPLANLGTDDGDGARPVRIAGDALQYRPGMSCVWIDWSGSPVVVAPLPMCGANPLDEEDDMEDWHFVGTGSEPAFQNSWVNFGSGHTNAGFYKQPDGWVRLKGLVASGTSTATIFTLPEGYRPPYMVQVTGTSNSDICTIQIDTSGNISKPAGGSNANVSLSGITFPSVWNHSQWYIPELDSPWDIYAPATNPTYEMFVREDGWCYCKGAVEGSVGSRIGILPERARVRGLDHIFGVDDVNSIGYGRVNLIREGVLHHQTGVATIHLGGLNWFSGMSAALWSAPTLLNSWANLGSPWESAGFYLDHMGVCHLQGVLTGSNNSPIFNLPAGYRPLEEQIFFSLAQTESIARIDISANGDVARGFTPAVGTGYLTLTGISFRVEQ